MKSHRGVETVLKVRFRLKDVCDHAQQSNFQFLFLFSSSEQLVCCQNGYYPLILVIDMGFLGTSTFLIVKGIIYVRRNLVRKHAKLQGISGKELNNFGSTSSGLNNKVTPPLPPLDPGAKNT